jgi:predicted nucleotidyltransferase
MDYRAISKEFAEFCYSRKQTYGIQNIVLYGSLAMGKQNPNDIDVMLIHSNPAFEKMQLLRGQDKCRNDIERVNLLDKLLADNGYPSFKDQINSSPNILQAIALEVLDINFLGADFSRDKASFIKAKSLFPDPTFFKDHLFKHGLIWNPESKDYDIPMASRYTLIEA